MNKSMLILSLFGALALSACDNKPDVINVPASPPAEAPAPVPGPAGPAGPSGPQGTTGTEGATGGTGATGSTGETGKSGDGTTVIITPPASAPAN